MQEISKLPVYTGTIPNKAAQSDNEFANNIFGFINYSGNVFVGNFNTIIGQFNVLKDEINTAASEVSDNKTFVANAKTTLEQTAAVLANGTINDTTTGEDKTYSSNKLDELFNDRYKKEETYSKVQVDTNIYTKTQMDTRLNSHIPLSAFTSYNLLDGNLSVDNYVTQKAIDTFLYTGNTTTLPTINLGMDLESQWGDIADETYGYILEFKPRSAVGGWTKVNSINGRTKYLDSSSTAIEGTDANLFTLSTVAGNTTLNVGTSSRVNTNGVTYMVTVWQLTHRKTSVTSQGKTQIEHYNPTTLETVIKYEGSSLAGHEVYHSLGRKLSFVTEKVTSTTGNWGTLDTITNKVMYLNSTDGSTLPIVQSLQTTSDTSITVGNGGYTSSNSSGNSYILYGQANAYIDESGKLIGNCEVGVYSGTGTTYNKQLTKGKPYRLEFKSLTGAYDWVVIDIRRDDKAIFFNINWTEITYNYLDVAIDGFILTDTSNATNASGGQYLYKVYYDTNANGGGGYYNKATDNANVQVNNGIIPLPLGIDSDGVKNSIVIANETVTGVTYTEGKNYLYKTTNGYGVSAFKPRYLKKELVRTYAGEQPDYFDFEKNKWFSCYASSELVLGGDFTSGIGAFYGLSNNGANTPYVLDETVLTAINGLGTITCASGKTYPVMEAIITVNIGEKVKLKFDKASTTSSFAHSLATSPLVGLTALNSNSLYYYDNTATGAFEYEFTASQTNYYLRLGCSTVTAGQYSKYDNVTFFPTEITPIAEIPETINYMNHIVHADANGNPLFVEELPKIKYEYIVKADEFQGRNTCTAWAILDATSVIPFFEDNHGFNKPVKEGTGIYAFYFDKDMDNTNYSVLPQIYRTGSTADAFVVGRIDKYLNKVVIYTGYISSTASGFTLNGIPKMDVHIFGGRN